MAKKILYSLFAVCIILLIAGSVIAYGRGYRINPNQKSINPTGILSAVSSPDAASIVIDNKLISATNGSFSLAPGWYQLQIRKEGYQSWEKRIKIQGEVVTSIDALLIPQNPSLRALTVSGLMSPTLSPSGTRVAYIILKEEATASAAVKSRTGVWIFDLRNSPLGAISDPKQIYSTSEKLDWANSSLLWSPDEKQIILVTKKKEGKTEKITSALQLFTDNSTNFAPSVTSSMDMILAEWEDLKNQKQDQILSVLPPTMIDFLKNSAGNIVFSPDNHKILYLATASAVLKPILTPPVIGSNPTPETREIQPNKYYVYDLKEDKNFYAADQKSISSAPLWYPDSKRIVMIENISIYIVDYDGTNKRTAYSGPFEKNIVFPWTSSGKLVILTNLNKPQQLPNLYEVDIR